MTKWILILIIMISIYLIYCYIFNKNMGTKKTLVILSTISLCILNLCLHLKPPVTFDLARYFSEIDYFRKLNINEVYPIIVSKVNIIFYGLEYLVGTISKSNYTIFMFSLSITLGVYGYILLDSKKEYNLTNRQVILSIFVFFSIISTIHLMSGIRNAMAVSFYALGMYLHSFKNKKWGYIFYLLSILTHSMTIIFFVFEMFTYLFKRVNVMPLFMLFWSITIRIVIAILSLLLIVLPVSFLKLYVYKISAELTIDFGTDYRILIFEILQVIVFTYLIKRSISKEEKPDNKILMFYYLSYFIIGSIMLINIFTRTRFIFAYFTPFILGYANKNKISNRRGENILFILSILINIYYAYYMYSNGVFI